MVYPYNAWRERLVPAYFKNIKVGGKEAVFHVESGSKESGRRIVVHEFPKKDLPYSEDMGRKAIEYSVRGYCIAYPWKPRNHPGQEVTELILQEDYTRPRDYLILHLEQEGPGVLQLPLLPPMQVVCQRYRLTEETRLGGYCTFDMSFVELGAPPFKERSDPRNDLIDASRRLRLETIQGLNGRGSMGARTRAPAWHPAPGVVGPEQPLTPTPVPF